MNQDVLVDILISIASRVIENLGLDIKSGIVLTSKSIDGKSILDEILYLAEFSKDSFDDVENRLVNIEQRLDQDMDAAK